MNEEPKRPTPVHRRRTVSVGRLLLVGGLALGIVLAGFGVYAFWRAQSAGPKTLVVYTYPSLLGGGCGGSVFTSLVHSFERQHGVTVDVLCPSGTLVSTLLAKKNAPFADLVIGLDEITGPQAEASGLLVPYASPALAHVNASLPGELTPDHGVTPYEWGYLGIDFHSSFATATRGAVAKASFENFSTNSSWASQLMVENPTIDITGEEFLLWQIACYTSVLHANWQDWWRAVDPRLQVAPDWSTAFPDFNATGGPSMVVSYSTDPAYSDFYGAPGAFNATVSWEQGTPYGWKTIYGIGIVAGSSHVGLDQQFIDWFLGGEVQSQIPTNEWEYPANESIPLPSSFGYAVDPREIVPLNDVLPAATVVSSLHGWLDAWQTIANQHP